MAQTKSASVPLQAPCTWPCSSLQADYCHCFSRLCLSSHQHRIPNSNSNRPSPRDQLYCVRTMDTRGTERRACVLLLTRGQLNRPQDTLDPSATPSSPACFLFLVFILTYCHSTRMGMRIDEREGESQAEQKLSSNFDLSHLFPNFVV